MENKKKYKHLNEDSKEKYKHFEVGEEDATKYGEFISSYFAWIPLPTQKEKAEELEKITKNTKLRLKKTKK